MYAIYSCLITLYCFIVAVWDSVSHTQPSIWSAAIYSFILLYFSEESYQYPVHLHPSKLPSFISVPYLQYATFIYVLFF